MANKRGVKLERHYFADYSRIVMQNVGKYVEEFAYWMDLKKAKKVEYKDYLYVGS